MKRGLIYLLVVALAGVAGWWGYQRQRTPTAPIEVGAPSSTTSNPGASAGKAGAPGAGGAPTPGGAGGRGPGGPAGVEVVKAVVQNVVEEVSAVGSLRANESVVIKPEFSGRIVQLNFTDGAQVKKGQSLVRFDESVVQAERDQSRAELALAEANFKRTSELAQRNFVSSSALDQAQSQLRIQQAKLQLIEARLAKFDLRAPFGGTLGLRNVSIGDFVKDGAELVTLEDISSMKVDLRLPEQLLGRVKKGQVLDVQIDALGAKRFAARIEAIDVQVDANGRSVIARGRVANPEGQLRTGMFARARLILAERPQAIVVPEEAIVPSGADTLVLKVSEGKAQRIKVGLGVRRDGKVELREAPGIGEGDLIVVAGQMRVQRDGQDVRIIDPNRRGSPGGAPPGTGGPPAGAGAAAGPPGAQNPQGTK